MGKPFNKFNAAARGQQRASWRGRGRGRGRGGHTGGTILKTEQDGTRMDDRQEDSKVSPHERTDLTNETSSNAFLSLSLKKVWDQLDEKLGFPKFSQGSPQQGWLVNMKEVKRFPLFFFCFCTTSEKRLTFWGDDRRS